MGKNRHKVVPPLPDELVHPEERVIYQRVSEAGFRLPSDTSQALELAAITRGGRDRINRCSLGLLFRCTEPDLQEMLPCDPLPVGTWIYALDRDLFAVNGVFFLGHKVGQGHNVRGFSIHGAPHPRQMKITITPDGALEVCNLAPDRSTFIQVIERSAPSLSTASNDPLLRVAAFMPFTAS